MNNIERIREVFRNCGLYAHAADDLLCERLAEVVGEPQPQASTYGGGYAVERHGDGWAIYCGRQQPRWRMGYLTECGPEIAEQIQAALNASPQPIAGEVWQYRANSTSRGKEWIDCRDERIARDMEALGFEIRCLYAAPPRPQASAEDVELVADYLHDFGYLRPAVYEAFQRIRASLGVGK